jgi:hypothetical protein
VKEHPRRCASVSNLWFPNKWFRIFSGGFPYHLKRLLWGSPDQSAALPAEMSEAWCGTKEKLRC